MVTPAVIALALLGASAPTTPDRLTPEDSGSPLEHYQSTVKDVLREGFAPGVTLRVLVEPSFQPEYVVGLRAAPAGGTEVFFAQPNRQIWTYELIDLMKHGRVGVMDMKGNNRAGQEVRRLTDSLPANPRDLPLSHCAASVDRDVADAVTDAWTRMLSEVQPTDEPALGLDGTSYHFSQVTDGRTISGQTWSPEPKTRTGRLVALVEEMRFYCTSRSADHLKQILSIARGLANSPPR